MLTNLMALIMAPAPRFRWGRSTATRGERNHRSACATRRAAGTLASVATASSLPSPMPMLLDDYVVETLMPDLVGHDRHPSAFLLYLALWRLTEGGRRESVASLRQLAEET